MHRKIVHHPNSHDATIHSITASTIYYLAYTLPKPLPQFVFNPVSIHHRIQPKGNSEEAPLHQ